MAGYSGKSVAEKLGLKAGMSLAVINSPESYGDNIGRDVLDSLHVAQSFQQGKTYDVIHLFVWNRADLITASHQLLEHLAPVGIIWISWPKKSFGKLRIKSSRVSTDLTEQTLRDVLLPLGIVDVKVCAVDDTWSGLKFVRRKTAL